jgi:hypothetical protein
MATSSAQFPEAEWLTLDCAQSGHYNGRLPGTSGDGQAGGFGDEFSIWQGSGPYEPIRAMFATVGPNGKPRPVLDLEAHYEALHHWFSYKEKLWTAADIRAGAWQSVIRPSIETKELMVTGLCRRMWVYIWLQFDMADAQE